MSVHKGTTSIDAIEKAFRDVIQGQSVERVLTPQDNWWNNNDNPVFAGYGFKVYNRQVEEKDTGLNDPGKYTQTAIVLDERAIVITGKKVEILNNPPSDVLQKVTGPLPGVEQAKKDAQKKVMHFNATPVLDRPYEDVTNVVPESIKPVPASVLGKPVKKKAKKKAKKK